MRTGELRTRRLAKGLSVEQVATLCGVSQSTISRWERGVTTPARGNHAADYAAALGLNPIDLVPEADVTNREDS